MSNPATAKFPSALATEADMTIWKNWTPSNATPVSVGSGGLTSSATTHTLATGTGTNLPTDNFMISIEDEIIFVGTRSGDALSGMVRAAEGTTAAAHSAGVSVFHRVTALAHNQLVAEVTAIESQLGTNLSNVVKATQLGAASGAASLDSSGHVPASQIQTRKVYSSNTTAVTKNAAVTTDQILMTAAVNAGDWDVVGKVIDVVCSGVITGQASATTITVKLVIAGVVTALSFPAVTVTSFSSAPFILYARVIRTATGTTGKTSAWGELTINTTTVAGRTLNATWDGTVNQTFEMVIDFSTASATNSITQDQMGTETVN